MKYVEMKLNPDPFFAIKSEKKSIEVRLMDEKRREISVGDIIIFTNRENEDEKIRAEVKALHAAASFTELFTPEILPKCGFGSATADEAVNIMHSYYTKEDEERYGALGIELTPVIDVYSKGEYPSKQLSNFYPHSFVIDGVECACMEGFLQSLKCLTKFGQRRVCALVGKKAKSKGAKKRRWFRTGYVRWCGQRIKRDSHDFDELILRAYDSLYQQSEEFREALNSTRGKTLTHSIGSHDKSTTILTEGEFIANLVRLRDKSE